MDLTLPILLEAHPILVEQHPDQDLLLHLQLVAMAQALALTLPRQVVHQVLAEPQALKLQMAPVALQISLVTHPILVEQHPDQAPLLNRQLVLMVEVQAL
ncbi:MAG: hypothetical protein ICV77_01330 [Cyanobacteria bacterium Co-bin8]|nr:hypothetical protein [Cyanobacteria bacterium Co-bin8]